MANAPRASVTTPRRVPVSVTAAPASGAWLDPVTTPVTCRCCAAAGLAPASSETAASRYHIRLNMLPPYGWYRVDANVRMRGGASWWGENGAGRRPGGDVRG